MIKFILKRFAPLRLIAPVFAVVCVVWLSISGVLCHSYVRVNGRVVDQVPKGSGDNMCYCPVTVYRDVTGVEHTVHSSFGSNPPRFPVGSAVSVLYQPQNPDDGMIEDHLMLWTVPLIFFGLSIIFSLVGMGAERLSRKLGNLTTS